MYSSDSIVAVDDVQFINCNFPGTYLAMFKKIILVYELKHCLVTLTGCFNCHRKIQNKDKEK